MIKLKPKKIYLDKWGLKISDVGNIIIDMKSKTKYFFFGKVLNHNINSPFVFDKNIEYAFNKKWFREVK